MPLSRSLLALRALAVAALLVVGACGSEIGDACQQATDCSPDGDRVCLRSQDQFNPDKDGYCTVVGCDHDTCPDEAVCIRFFSGSFAGKTCDPKTEDLSTDMCSLDELCSLQGFCALRASEIRFCMRSCGGNDDCRGNYECRDLAAMQARGGEPVLPDGDRVGDSPARFCAVASVPSPAP
jgi:hypothetical protein